ncbi:MAG: hypothetical protein Q9P90_01310 [candidate division KSB1 bacterium]|nr:hypothetical protein [candidate division KSB1 bacterium]
MKAVIKTGWWIAILTIAMTQWHCKRSDENTQDDLQEALATVRSLAEASTSEPMVTITSADSVPAEVRRRWKRNPFLPVSRKIKKPEPGKPAKKPEPRQPQFRLQGIMWSNGQGAAIINNRMVVAGKRYDHFEVLEIKPEFVRIRVFPDERIITLKWRG